MPKPKNSIADPTDQLSRFMIIASIMLIAIFGWLWWTKVYQSPRAVFNAMLNNNLSSYGMSKRSVQSAEGNRFDQSLQLQLGATPIVRARTILQQPDQNGQESSVTTETISTVDESYVRYTDISIGEANASGDSPDFSPVLGQWGKEDVNKEQGANGLLTEAMYDVIPFARLSPSNRQELLKYIKDNDVYSVDYSKVNRTSEGGRVTFEYPVTIKPAKYIAMLKQLDAMTGINQLTNLDVSQYEAAEPISLTVTVDSMSRILNGIRYSGSERSQTYSAPGLFSSPTIPGQTIPRSELETKVQQIGAGN